MDSKPRRDGEKEEGSAGPWEVARRESVTSSLSQWALQCCHCTVSPTWSRGPQSWAMAKPSYESTSGTFSFRARQVLSLTFILWNPWIRLLACLVPDWLVAYPTNRVGEGVQLDFRVGCMCVPSLKWSSSLWVMRPSYPGVLLAASLLFIPNQYASYKASIIFLYKYLANYIISHFCSQSPIYLFS